MLPDHVLPSAYVSRGQALDTLARILFEKTTGEPIAKRYIEQLYTFSDIINHQAITIGYYGLMQYEPQKQWNWVALDRIDPSHRDFSIISYALQRLRWKVEYTNVVYSLLPEEFTLRELQETYEAILGRPLDKRNFRKKLLNLHVIESTGKRIKTGKTRPAATFRFKKRQLTFVEIV